MNYVWSWLPSLKLMKRLKKLITYLSYLFVFLLPWQTKLILRSGANNYQEIALYAWHLMAIFLALLYLFFIIESKKYQLNYRSWPIYIYIALAWLLIHLISLFISADIYLSLYHFCLLILGLLVFAVLKNKDLAISRFWLAVSFLSSIAISAILAISQFVLQKSWANKFFGLNSHDPAVLGTAVIELSSGRWLRSYGSFDHPNILGGVMVFALLFSLYYLIEPRRYADKKSNYSLLFFWLTYLLSLTALFFSFSRAAFLAFGAAVLIFIFGLARQRVFAKLFRLGFVLLVSVFLLFVFSYSYKDLLRVRLEGQERLERQSLEERRSDIVKSFSVISSRSWLGWGRGNYVANLGTENSYPQPVHNVFLLSFAELGVVGFFGLLAWLLYAFKKAGFSILSTGCLLALFILMMLDHWLFSLPFGVLFFWFLFGFI